MNVLISNDDGIFAPGVQALANRLAQDPAHHITVVCPDRERSATGHALTLYDPVRVESVQTGFDPRIQAWSCSGTPADCVKFGLDALLDSRPDWVVCGINQGSNLGTDVLYSGTVSAAMEGLLSDIPSMAVSLASYTSHDFQVAANTAADLLSKFQAQPLPQPTLLNVNIPCVAADQIRGMVLVPLGVQKYTDLFEKRQDPRGRTYYWLAGEILADGVDPVSDIQAVQDNYITITPLQPNLTARDWFPVLNAWGLQLFG